MKVYLDHCATTPCDQRVTESMQPYFADIFGNADSQHAEGRESAKAVNLARKSIASNLNCQPNEIYFTGSGTESDNWALKGACFARKNKGNHVIISAIEHHAVLTTAQWLANNGFEISYAPVDKHGIVMVDQLEQLIRSDTILISVMYVNNEVGTIQPIQQIAAIAKAHSILFHSDCVQAAPYLPIDVAKLGVDMLTISGHKFYGPKGVGLLYIKNGVRIDKLIHGGGQERSRRGGTTNTPYVVGMAKALQLAVDNMQSDNMYIAKLRNHFVQRVNSEIDYCYLNGDLNNMIPSVANYSFEFIEGEGILMLLDFNGIQVSSGSACSSGSLDPSHVLLAMGVPIELSHGSIRFSFGKDNTIEQVDYTVDKLKQCIDTLRNMSPLFNIKKGEVTNV